MVDWTFNTVEVGWMTERLANFWDCRLASFAPVGFPACGRLLHPAHSEDGQWVRWAEVAAHNGLPMAATRDFSHLALPQSIPNGGTLWMGDPPETGTLEWAQAEHLIDVLTPYTDTPDAVNFALWDGLGSDHATLVTPGYPSEPALDPIPPAIRLGPRMRIFGRDYSV